jgi:hypothetical protein
MAPVLGFGGETHGPGDVGFRDVGLESATDTPNSVDWDEMKAIRIPLQIMRI